MLAAVPSTVSVSDADAAHAALYLLHTTVPNECIEPAPYTPTMSPLYLLQLAFFGMCLYQVTQGTPLLLHMLLLRVLLR